MNKKRYNDAIFYILIGIMFLLLTLDIAFPIIIAIIKGVFYIIGILLIVGGLVEIKDSFKKKKDEI